MSLRKSPTLTPALLEACRQNAQKSTGPRTALGKAQTRMNALRSGKRSRIYQNLQTAFRCAPPGYAGIWAARVLTEEKVLHPKFRELAEIYLVAEYEVGQHFHQLYLEDHMKRK